MAEGGLGPEQLWLLEGLVAEGVRPAGAVVKPKVSIFIDCYMRHLNGAKAATEAGYSARSARQIAHRLLTSDDIRSELRRRLEERHRDAQVSVAGILELMRKLAHADIRMAYRPDGSLKPVHEMPDELAARIAGIETEERLSLNGIDLDDDVVAALRQALAALGVDLDARLELTMVRVRKVKWWDPNKAVEMLGRYRKMLGGDTPPASPPILQLPEALARRLAAPGDDAIDVTPTPARDDAVASRGANGVREGE